MIVFLLMLICYFGVPGSGKTSVLAIKAQQELQRIRKGKSKYKHVYTSFFCLGCEKIDLYDLGRYYIEPSLILLDELTLSADSRDWKSFPQHVKSFITLHRHYGCDLIFSVQDWSRCDKTIRQNCQYLFYCTRSPVPFFNRWVHCKRIFRTIAINDYSSELITGYRFSEFLERLFNRCDESYYLPKAWKYFNSFDSFGFDELTPFQSDKW